MAEENENGEDKSEQPTEQRREEFKKRGDVFQSKEIASLLVLGAAIIVFYVAGMFFFEQIMNLMRELFTELNTFKITVESLSALSIKMAKVMGMCLFPVLVGTLVAGILSSLAQAGFIFSTELIRFDLDKINPINGFKQFFSPKKLADVVKAVIKLTIIGGIAYSVISNEITNSSGLAEVDVKSLLPYFGKAIFRLVIQVGVLLVVLSLLDFLWERFKYEQRLKMTKQELKEDMKRSEGDPLIKSRIRSLQRAISQKRMMDSIPKAQVILTNPTHIAIALEYDRENMPAPKLVAKGAGFIAEKIKELAKQHGVPIVVNKPLAHVMYKKIKIGQFIPRDLFEATAKVLAYIFKLKGKTKK